MARTLLLAAVSGAGLPDRGIELTAGVMAMIDRPDAEARWPKGENVFEGVLGADRKPSARVAQDRISTMLRALVDRGSSPSSVALRPQRAEQSAAVAPIRGSTMRVAAAVRRHLGVDYAAEIGTPIVAVFGGKVLEGRVQGE